VTAPRVRASAAACATSSSAIAWLAGATLCWTFANAGSLLIDLTMVFATLMRAGADFGNTIRTVPESRRWGFARGHDRGTGELAEAAGLSGCVLVIDETSAVAVLMRDDLLLFWSANVPVKGDWVLNALLPRLFLGGSASISVVFRSKGVENRRILAGFRTKTVGLKSISVGFPSISDGNRRKTVEAVRKADGIRGKTIGFRAILDGNRALFARFMTRNVGNLEKTVGYVAQTVQSREKTDALRPKIDRFRLKTDGFRSIDDSNRP
jgi:hypothetical protein